MRPPIIIYHAGCADGWTAAWIAHHHFGGACELHAAHYRDTPPDVDGRDVYILDFSYPLETFREVTRRAASTTLLDHHKNVAKDLEPILGASAGVGCHISAEPDVFARIDLNHSGARLALDYFGANYSAARMRFLRTLVDYVEDRDLWRWVLPASHSVNAWIRAQPFTLEAWNHLVEDLNEALSIVVIRGVAILKHVEGVIESHVDQARWGRWIELGHDPDYHEGKDEGFPVVNATTERSEIGNRLSMRAPFSATYRLHGHKIIYSLRSSADNPAAVDVAAIARSFGGGGHKHAAGFVVKGGELAHWIDEGRRS